MGKPAVIVGVMPEKFAFPNNQRLWIPLAPVAVSAPRKQRDLNVFARLAPGATLASADAGAGDESRRSSRRQLSRHERGMDCLHADPA